ncbi:MAG: hypothetical protein WC979_01935 [Candidatus Pacearchaeota archaeon]|jgi:hypothetical protein|nr:hypothetical protein [Clostridia bacterium]
MANRVPTLDEYINESKQLNEGKTFNWNAQKVAKNFNEVNEDEPLEPTDREVALWVTITNLFNEFDLEVYQDLDAYSISGVSERGIYVGIDSEIFENKQVTLTVTRAKPQDIEGFAKAMGSTAPSAWSFKNTDYERETVTYKQNKLDVRVTGDLLEKLFRKFVNIMK